MRQRVALLAHLGASVCACGDVCEESACDTRIRGVCEVIGSEMTVCERFHDEVCDGLTLLRNRGMYFVVVDSRS